MECDEQFNAGEFLPVTQISEAFPLRRSMGRLDSVDRVGLMDSEGLMDGVDLVDGMWLWVAVCGGLYGMPDLL